MRILVSIWCLLFVAVLAVQALCLETVPGRIAAAIGACVILAMGIAAFINLGPDQPKANRKP